MSQRKDGSEWFDLSKPRPVYKSEIDLSTLPEAAVRQKVAKNKNWQVCRSWLNADSKLFVYECLVNPHETAMRSVTFDEVCKEMHWKNFTLLNDNQTIKWQRDPVWDEEVEAIAKRLAEQAAKDKAKEKVESKVQLKTEWRSGMPH